MLTGYDIWYRFDGGSWKFWNDFSETTTSAVFTFPFAADGRYEFQATTYNDVPLYEPLSDVPEAGVIVDRLPPSIQQKLMLPVISVE